MFSSEELFEKVKKTLADLNFQGKPEELYNPIIYTMSGGGKRIRPVLTLLTCDMFCGDIDKAIYPAISLEIFHNFTLIHDDIMDNAPLRRGKETVYKKWNSNIAILSGDTMFALAYRYLVQTDKSLLHSVIDILTEAAIGVCEGQQLDMNYENSEQVSIEDYIQMIHLKTAVLIAASIKTGATVAKASPAEIQSMYDFGINLGIAFQLQDDLLDVYGDTQKFGKKIGGDIAINKKTYLILKAMEMASGEDKQKLSKLFLSVNTDIDKKVNAVTEIYNKYQIKENTYSIINDYYSKALQSLSTVKLPDENKEIFKKYTDALMLRDY